MPAQDKGLFEATKLAPLVSADRLRLARELRGWTQRSLADEMESSGNAVTPAALSQLELGRTTPTGKTLLAIAGATGLPLDYFIRHDADSNIDGFFRSLRSAPARERRWAVARAHLLHDAVRVVEHYVELPDLQVPRISLPVRDRASIEEAASIVRTLWGLGSFPVPNVLRELEGHGIPTTRLALDRKKLDAFSVWFPDRPIVVLVADKDSTARSRFDAAHELGHGVLHGPSDVGTKEAEQEAHWFAAAFLMPEESISNVLAPSVKWRELMDVKAEWGVSLAALLLRARNLKILSDARYVSAVKYMSARGWRKAEPGDRLLGPPEEPRLIQAAVRQLQKTGLDIEDLAGEAGLPAGDLRELLTLGGNARQRIEP